MKRLALASMIFVAPFEANADHFVYVYDTTQNVSHTCTAKPRTYVDWTGYGNSFYEGCSVTGTDTSVWPATYAIDTHTAHIAPLASRACKFVAYADLGGDTSLVIDCR